MKKIFLILVVLVLSAAIATPAMAKSRYHFNLGIFLPIPPAVIIFPPPTSYPDYPSPPPHGYYGGHWETRWEWDPYSQRWYKIEVWVDDYPYYGRQPRRW